MDWRVFTSLTENGKGYPKRGDAIGCSCSLCPVTVWAVRTPAPLGARRSGPGPLPVRGEDWLALASLEVAESFDGVGGVAALTPCVARLGLPPRGIFGIEFGQDDIAISYPSTVDDLDSVGEHENPSTPIVVS